MSIALHRGTSFLVSDDAGEIAPGTEHGYFHLDTRFLSRHQLRLDGESPILLQPSSPDPADGWYFLSNPSLGRAPRETLGITVHRALGEGHLREVVEVENFGDGEACLALSISFASDFAYILTVKREAAGCEGERWNPHVDHRLSGVHEVVLTLAWAGIRYRTAISFDPTPALLIGDEARWSLVLPRRSRWRGTVGVSARIGEERLLPGPRRTPGAVMRARREALAREVPTVRTDHPVLGEAFARARRDLLELRIHAPEPDEAGGGESPCAIAAGIPWYMDLFGRDSLIASYQAMLEDPRLARGTLAGLARLQGKKVDPVSEEAPGKILHEYRRGPLSPAARRIIPTYPYYGSIDATPLFLVTLSEYVRCTGDLGFAREHWEAVRAAVEWMRRYGDRDGDGLLEYQRDSDLGLQNQCWKDSDDSIRFHDGAVARPPIAVVEVQGYALDARRRVAQLARCLGEPGEAERLEDEAAALERRISDRFWLPDRSFFAEALDREKRPVDSLTSNPGHLLWAGAVDEDDARAIARILLSEEMFTGYGIRTMGEREGGYNPLSYHNGSVWPHDSALALAGLARYGLRDEAARLAAGILTAIARFPEQRPPELFCGYPASRFGTPVRYPSASSPQAWASGAVLLLVRAVLGLDVDALERRVSVSPIPVPGLGRLDLLGVRVGEERLDVSLRVERGQASAELSRLPTRWEQVEPAKVRGVPPPLTGPPGERSAGR